MDYWEALSMIRKDAILSISNMRLRQAATYASVSVAIILIVTKMFAYFMTNSVAMLSSLLDSTIDLMSSLVTAYGVASALRPPDHDHRYGHGKAEPLAALAQAAFIIGSSVLLAYEALHRLYHPEPLQNEVFGYSVMVLAIVATACLVAFQRYVIRRTRSMAIKADYFHYVGDLLINLAVVASFALTGWTGLTWFDPVLAIVIAGGLAFTAFRIAVHALNVLMDRELPDADRERIIALVRAQEHVRGVHDLRTRTDGERIFIEFHLELDATMTLRTAHKIDEAIMAVLKKTFPNADILIHQDPAGIKEVRLDEQIEKAAEGK